MGAPGQGKVVWCEGYYDRICANWATLEWVRSWAAGPESPLAEAASAEQDAHSAELFRYRASRGIGDSRPS